MRKTAFRILSLVAIPLTLACGLGAPNNSNAATIQPDGRTWVRTDGSLMMGLRSNANHFWSWAAMQGKTYFPEELIKFSGIVAGDPHHENFSFVFAQNQRVYVLNDMDDAGYAPLYLDFLKFLGVTMSAVDDKSADSALTIPDMLRAYLAGVTGQHWSNGIPEWLQEDANVSKQDFAADYLKKIKNQTSHGEFDGKDGMIVFKDMSDTQKKCMMDLEARVFKNALPSGYDIKDRAMYAKSSGGSRGEERYWYYLKKSDDDRQIIEFKPVAPPAVAYFQPQQPPPAQRMRLTTAVYWERGVPAPFQVVGQGEEVFWERPRYPSYVDLNLKMFLEHPKKFADLSTFIAYRMGSWHSKQAGNPDYAKYLAENIDKLIEPTTRAVYDYLKLARTAQKGKR